MKQDQIERLIELCSIQSYSENDERMKAYIYEALNDAGLDILNADIYEDDGNIYVDKGAPSILKPCIVAHMDTVHPIREDLTVLRYGDNLTGFDRVNMKQAGIGGDDKCGIFVALELLRKYDDIKVVFFRDEEIGCQGSYNADVEFFQHVQFILQADRRGNRDFIHNAYGTELNSKKFRKAVKPLMEKRGYRFEKGLMTDVMALKEIGVNISAANVSCGYYRPHSNDEYINIPDLFNCLGLFIDIIDTLQGKQYQHTAPARTYAKYDYKGYTGKQYAPDYDWDSLSGYNRSERVKCEGCNANTEEEKLKLHRTFQMYLCEDCYRYAEVSQQ